MTTAPSLRPLALASLCVAALALGGCGDTRRALGIEKATPDEFRIVTRAPLSLPPDYSLRPPQPGAPRPQERASADQARATVIGTGAAAPVGGIAGGGNVTPGETALLAKAGSERTDPNIREKVNVEAVQQAEADRYLLDRLLFWRKQDQPGTVVDPTLESQRLRENQALGRPVTTGETPTIQRRRRAPLEGIF